MNLVDAEKMFNFSTIVYVWLIRDMFNVVSTTSRWS